jgi:hypothetical protein
MVARNIKNENWEDEECGEEQTVKHKVFFWYGFGEF